MPKSHDDRILAVLAFGEAMGTPMTAQQVWQRMPPGPGAVSLAETLDVLARLSAHGTVRAVDGWYAPAGTPSDAFIARLDRLNMRADKFRRMLRKAFWLQGVPFVRALAASGSMSAGTTGADSDWDMFVIARAGRLYTARFFLVAAAWCVGSLRTKRDRIAPDKFCFNHYVTDRGLVIRHRSRYVAHALASLIPVHDPGGYVDRLRQANGWVAEYIARWPVPSAVTVRRTVRRSRILGALRYVAELVLRTPLGGLLERVLRSWQQGRIHREPVTHARGGRVVADGQELEFHPHSAERAVVARYNARMAALGMPVQERDSGLR
ncbi:MAG TPA: hypothetical protein VD862_00175 [Candidatus Paceibacterota bacterium]|nr:hypothetical protein [Candidatus Paceibacterota bacterium]